AMYAEVRSPDGVRAKLGSANHPRLDVLKSAAAQGTPWFTTASLFEDDAIFEQAEHEQLAYAQSWLLVHGLMGPARSKAFAGYLAAIRTRRDAKQRVADATAAFGPLDRLDRELR